MVDTLFGGQSLTGGQSITSNNGFFNLPFQTDGNLVLYKTFPGLVPQALWWSGTDGHGSAFCIMQTDGNLVIYDPGTQPIWSSNTHNNPGSRLVMQDDGNLVIYAPNNVALWNTSTVSAVPVNGPPASGSQATPGQTLAAGVALQSLNGIFSLIFQTDGNLVLYRTYPNHPNQALWWSGTDGDPAAVCILQGDGNLVIYDFNASPLWSSGSHGNDNSTLVVQDDGNVVIYTPGGVAVWNTNTVQALLPSGPSANGAAVMNPGDVLLPGEAILSASTQFQFIFQTDGNLVWYDMPAGPSAVWNSGTNGQTADLCIMQTDGNLVVYGPNANALWNSGTNGNPGARLIAQDDGNAVIYTPDNTAVWNVFSVLQDDSGGFWGWLADVGGAVVGFIETVVGAVADAAGALFSIILAIPILGGFIRTLWNWGIEIFWRLVGLFDFGLSLLGVRPRKQMTFGIIIPTVNGAPIATTAQLAGKVGGTISTYDRLCNIDLVFTGFATFATEPPDGAMTPGCDETGFFADWIGNWGLVGSWYEIAAIGAKFEGGWRRSVGYGGQIIVFVVQNVMPDTATSSTVGCSFAATHDYIFVEATAGPQVIAHEIGHACLLAHRPDESQNLMFPSSLNTTPTLTGWQISVIRSSRHCTYL